MALIPFNVSPISPGVYGSCCCVMADLGVTKSVDNASTLVGQDVTYTITITNSGPDAADGATITDVLPVGFTVDLIVKSEAGGAVTTTPSEASLAAGHTITTFPAGGSVTITVIGTYSGIGTFNNTATVAVPVGVSDPVSGNNTATAPHTAVLLANLAVTKSVLPATAQVGTPFTYTVTVSNTGPSAANGAIVTDVLPAGFTVTGIVATYGSGAAGGTPTAGDLAAGYAITTLPMGGSVSFAITGTVATVGAFDNQATVTPPSGVTDPTPGNNTSTTETHTSTPAPGVADISVDKDDLTGGNVVYGAPHTFRITWTNNGPDSADTAILKDTPGTGYAVRWWIPSSVTLTYTGGASGPASMTDVALVAGFSPTAFPAGSTIVAEFLVAAIVPGNSNKNNADVIASGYSDPVAANDTDQVTFNTRSPTPPCACGQTLTVDQGDIFAGNRFTGDISASCCDSLVVNAERYGSAADASTGTNPIAYTQSFITSADCLNTSWQTTNMAAGWYKFYACVTKGAFSCCVTENGQILNPPPYGSPGAVNYATWPTHRVN